MEVTVLKRLMHAVVCASNVVCQDSPQYVLLCDIASTEHGVCTHI